MKEGPDIAHIAALIGDPARANILTALMDGRALTASELAEEAGVALSTASGHLSKLADADLVSPRKQGRHKYFQLAGADVAGVLEALMGLASARGTSRVRTGPRDSQMQEARVCYNHLAGRRGVQMYQSLLAQEFLIEQGEEVTLTEHGRAFFETFGIDVSALRAGRTKVCRSCLDWSERRNHLAGSLGRAVLSRLETLEWTRRDPKSRAVLMTDTGRAEFDAVFPDI